MPTSSILLGLRETVKLIDVIEEIVGERGLSRETLKSIVAAGLTAAYEKKYPNLVLRANTDKNSGDIAIEIEKEIVPSIEDEEFEITLKKARALDKEAEVGGRLWVPFEGSIGRIEVLHARQVIAQQIRKIEAKAVFDEYKSREGEVVHGVVHKCERTGIVIKVDEQLAFLPKSLSSPLDKFVVGFTVRALLKEVLEEPRGDSQLILDRASSEFVRQLFELEIPEMFEKLVEIKKIVRAPGYKTKVLVSSNEKNIDPVGTCVGVGGSRIKPILKELNGEKIDILPWTESIELLIKNALKPAVVDRIEMSDDNQRALIYLEPDQRSLAIGRMGQNISLAGELVGMELQLVDNQQGARTIEIDGNDITM
jgi:transcription termination/antitermination protein NusA